MNDDRLFGAFIGLVVGAVMMVLFSSIAMAFDASELEVRSSHHVWDDARRRPSWLRLCGGVVEVACQMMSGMESLDDRPEDCRNRQRDEGKMYPKSGCMHCGTGGITGCPYENPERRTDMPSVSVEPTGGYLLSPLQQEMAEDEVYARGKAFFERPEVKATQVSFTLDREPQPFSLPIQRVLHREVSAAMDIMRRAVKEKQNLLAQLSAQERVLATAREELGAVLDAWPAEKVVAA